MAAASATASAPSAVPLKHIIDAFAGCFVAGAPSAGFGWGDLALIALRGAAGLRIATRGLRREAMAGS